MIPVLRSLTMNMQHPLNGRIVTIGSAQSCHLKLSGLPPRAAHLLFGQGLYMVQRLKADVEVMVNDMEVSTFGTPLRHGDILKIGSHKLQFIDRLDDEVREPSMPPPENSASTLRELIDTAVTLLRSRDEALFVSLVASVARLLHGDGARMVIDDPEGKRITVAQYPQGVGLDRFSNRAIDWARDAARTILMHEDEWKLPDSPELSLEKNLVSSIMCAPLKRGGSICGYLYLDRINQAAPFTEEERSFCDALLPLLSEILTNLREKQQQQATIARLQQQRMAPSGGILFESDCMAQLIALAQRLARTDSPVLITGETGTGKELLARFIHEQSNRSEGPFRPINCGALPENLIESELFGHEKGSFTGASSKKPGLFESAQNGTVFLDEIGELPLHLQVKLLRVLQESEVIPVGATESIHVNVRIVAATNRDLEAQIAAGKFRQDLYFRINVLKLHLPPLRKRGDDIALLAEFFITRYCQQFGIENKTLSVAARNSLLSHHWPGNVRELENVIQKAILLSDTDRITPEHIMLNREGSPQDAQGTTKDQTLREARSDAERRAITATLKKTHGNVSLCARILDIDRKWLIKKIEELDINAYQFRG